MFNILWLLFLWLHSPQRVVRSKTFAIICIISWISKATCHHSLFLQLFSFLSDWASHILVAHEASFCLNLIWLGLFIFAFIILLTLISFLWHNLTDAFVTIVILIILFDVSIIITVTRAIFAFESRYQLERILTIHCFLLVSYRAKINLLQSSIIIIIEFFKIVWVFRQSSALQSFVGFSNLEAVLAGKLNNTSSLLVVNNDEYLLSAKVA